MGKPYNALWRGQCLIAEVPDNNTPPKPIVLESWDDEFTKAILAVCLLTRAAAEEFIEREKHNLTSPRIWVDAIPHRSTDMLELLSALDVITNKVESAAHVTVISNE